MTRKNIKKKFETEIVQDCIPSEQVLVIIGAQREVLKLGSQLREVGVVVPLQCGVDVVGHCASVLDVTIIGSEVSLLSCELPDGKPVVEVRIVLCRPLVGVVAVPRVVVTILGLEISSKPTPTVESVVQHVVVIAISGGTVDGVWG